MNEDEIKALDMFAPCTIDGRHVKAVYRVMRLLYQENRLTGDAMRDAAQLLQPLIDDVQKLDLKA